MRYDVIHEFRKNFHSLVIEKGSSPAFIVTTDINSFTISYSELDRLLDRCINLFQKNKLNPGDVILTILPNKIETILIFLAAMKGGYVFSPAPCTLTKGELQKTLDLVKPKVCFISSIIKAELIEVFTINNIKSKLIACDNTFSWLEYEVNTSTMLYGDNPLIYITTSGTTGEPKVMVIDANRLWSSGCAFMQAHNLHGQDLRFWNYLPMSYLGGLFNLTLIPLCIGGSVVIDDIFSGKTFLNFWRMVDRFQINALWFVPSIVFGLLQISDTTKNSDYMRNLAKNIKVSFLGTAPISLENKRKFQDVFGIRLLENFALSETTFCTTEKIEENASLIEGSTGKVLPYVELKFCDLAHHYAKDNFKEIYVKTPYQFLGYLKNGTYVSSCDKDGFLPSGDLGYLDKDGNLIINGRIRDIIKKGGYFVSLREIELLAESCYSVSEAIAVKHSHSFYGESYTLFVQSSYDVVENKQILDEITYFIHHNLVSYKWPEKIIVKNSFPRTNSGKVQKHLLLDLAD